MRARVRLNLLAILRVAVGIAVFWLLWMLIAGGWEVADIGFRTGVLGFFVFGGWLGAELNLAIEAANLRIDAEVIRNDRNAARLARLEKAAGLWVSYEEHDREGLDDGWDDPFPRQFSP